MDKTNSEDKKDVLVEHNVRLTTMECTIIFNVLANGSYKAGDGELIMPILRKFKPLVAVATNIPPESAKKQAEEAKLVLTKKEN